MNGMITNRMNLLTIILFIIAGMFGFYYGQKNNGDIFVARNFKKGAKAHILEELKKQGRITNNEVESIVGVSDRTATRYLDELEKEGKIMQVGDTGQSVYYILK